MAIHSQTNFRARSVDVHQFAMIPRADIPRSSFRIESAHKTTFDAGFLIPIYVDEVLPGDHIQMKLTAFSRMTTPLYPIMDNLYMDTFFFFVPNRLVWQNWKKFMGEQTNPGDSTSFVIPQIVSPPGGYDVASVFNYMGLLGGNLGASATFSHSAMFLRAYNLIYNEWFRDENLQNSVPIHTDDGPDPYTDYVLLRRGKRHDYFTSCLPWPQKGASVMLPLGTRATVHSAGSLNIGGPPAELVPIGGDSSYSPVGSSGDYAWSAAAGSNTGMWADLSTATSATINQIRQSFQVQKLLERDARGGTRYTEIVRSHFGVISPDARLQRPEYLGGGSTPINITPIAQTSGTAAAGTTTPLATLSALGTAVANGHGFSQAFTEHGMIIGLVSVRADLNYQQGIRRMWSRKTRYDFYFPVFAHLGEQAVLNKEIYLQGTTDDDGVFGYQERWAEYRYRPSLITGRFNSNASGTLDGWHLAQRFTALPTLSPDFIVENPPMPRVLAVNTETSAQFYFDSIFDVKATRPMPLYSVPGLIDHF